MPSTHHTHTDAPPHQHPHVHVQADHSHAPSEQGEGYAARRHPEFVAIDIGGDVGALIVHTDPDMHGIEIEISRAGEDGNRSHKQVLERKLGDRPAFTAVFDGLLEGRYTLWVDDRPRERDVEIEGGRISELDWRTKVPA